MYKNKKVMIIGGSVLAIAVIIIVVIVSNNGTTRYAKKMKNYLEKVGYNCNGVYKYEDGYLDTEGKYIYCQMTTSNGVYKEVTILKNYKDAVGVDYKESVNEIYHFSIQGQDYKRQHVGEKIIYKDEMENKTFNFFLVVLTFI